MHLYFHLGSGLGLIRCRLVQSRGLVQPCQQTNHRSDRTTAKRTEFFWNLIFLKYFGFVEIHDCECPITCATNGHFSHAGPTAFDFLEWTDFQNSGEADGKQPSNVYTYLQVGR